MSPYSSARRWQTHFETRVYLSIYSIYSTTRAPLQHRQHALVLQRKQHHQRQGEGVEVASLGVDDAARLAPVLDGPKQQAHARVQPQVLIEQLRLFQTMTGRTMWRCLTMCVLGY